MFCSTLKLTQWDNAAAALVGELALLASTHPGAKILDCIQWAANHGCAWDSIE